MVPSALRALSSSLDRDSFVLLITPVLPAAHRLAFGMLGNATDAEDAVQTALLKAWRGIGTFRAGSEPRPWLLAIVANECRQQLRSPWWRVLRGHGLPDYAGSDPPDAGELRELREALAELPVDLRLVIVLRYYLDLTYDDIGAALGITPVAARTRAHRALQRLRVEVGEDR